jgi:hypothetical protein
LNRSATLWVCILIAGCGHGETSDWERKHEERLAAPAEEALALPAYPKTGELIEFFVAATSEFRFFIDPASLSVGSDGVVRYVLVARSPAGVDNVSFEGMRCTSAEVRTYALGRDGAWTGKPGAWRTIEPRSVQRWHNALQREYFCPQKAPIGSAREGIDALRRGGHPFARGFSGDALKQH